MDAHGACVNWITHCDFGEKLLFLVTALEGDEVDLFGNAMLRRITTRDAGLD